jgi:hypothetical protein
MILSFMGIFLFAGGLAGIIRLGKQVVGDSFERRPVDAILGIVDVLDLLEYLPGLVFAQVGTNSLHVVDAPDGGDLAVLGQELVDLVIDVDVVRIMHDRYPFRLLVIETEAKFGELPFKFLLAVVEVGIDAGCELVEQANHGVNGVCVGGVMKLFHDRVPFR